MKTPLLLLVWLLPALGFAQGYTIAWHQIGGNVTSTGTNSSTNGVYLLDGTASQPVSGTAQRNGFALTGGYRAVITLDQVAGAPTLFITHKGQAVTLHWQQVGYWYLQQTSDLASPADWTTSPGVITQDGTSSLSLTNVSGHLCFRLASP
jgi:hypothetical protein